MPTQLIANLVPPLAPASSKIIITADNRTQTPAPTAAVATVASKNENLRPEHASDRTKNLRQLVYEEFSPSQNRWAAAVLIKLPQRTTSAGRNIKIKRSTQTTNRTIKIRQQLTATTTQPRTHKQRRKYTTTLTGKSDPATTFTTTHTTTHPIRRKNITVSTWNLNLTRRKRNHTTGSQPTNDRRTNTQSEGTLITGSTAQTRHRLP